ncbi:calcium-translocating P-type ATPase, PMCA-type [Cyphellophora europaea CBS 101466]|uniref:Calcium-transporting ATPase n=1 Tax=Cyphellophora europaea (strain CBS 101466) TaxID=1220924 RepID=W2RMM5_CYPE1|nr:calcium-translocating P-type ATPase, PMCA-type [Cyphellophora europaea CBS 101466]ETN36943.1 calcium-translocating P-type ATPase, PMCA-type [Cyphellophora europaea CBS 101466]
MATRPTLQVPLLALPRASSDDAITPSEANSLNPFLSAPPSACGRSSASSASFFDDAEAILRPDPGTEADFLVSDNPFAFSPGQLNKLLNPKSLQAFVALGGLRGIASGLRTDTASGLSVDETMVHGKISFDQAIHSEKAKDFDGASSSSNQSAFADRIRVYKKNILPAKKATPLWKLMWAAYKDKVLLLLTAAAVISLALGLYETLGAKHEPGAPTPVDWVEGVAICVAIIIVVGVGSLNDWQKERAFVRLNQKKEDREVKAIRSGKSLTINVADILVGDVLHIEPGDMIPADGVFINGSGVKCDESSATGESDALKKSGGDYVMRLLAEGQADVHDLDPFIISGAKVLEGVGTYLVTSVGVNSSFGKIMMSVRTEVEATPLQKKLEGLASAIAQLGASAAGLLFFVLLFRFCAGLPSDARTSAEKASSFMDILIVAITVIVVAVPEGLPLAVTLALAFATTRLLKENNLVRVLRACETMGNATTICSDKTGTLTTNRMTVVAGCLGGLDFGEDVWSSLQTEDLSRSIVKAEQQRIIQSIALNSTAFEGEEDGKPVFVGSKTETAMLQFVRDHMGMEDLAIYRANSTIVHFLPFNSKNKYMASVIKLASGQYRLLVKGASEVLLQLCSTMSLADGSTIPLSSSKYHDRITAYAEKCLRTIGLVCKDFHSWPPTGTASKTEPTVADLSTLLHDMTLLGIVGIRDPVRPGVPEAVRKAQGAGVTVRMVSGDNVVTAKAIAVECGIFTQGGLVMEGPVFRTLNDAQMTDTIPRLQVLARSSPEDKRVLVAKLKAMGETVAVTGDGTNDAPALKTADVGFSMGISGTEVAKEASSIVLMNDNFTSILTALMWGRAVNDAVQKFLQFQITVNITAVLLTFVSAVSSSEMQSVLTAVQLLWVNLIMDTFAALALATDPPTEKILDRKPQGKRAPLITINMWKMIIGQAIFQLAVTFVLYFAGAKILGYGEERRLELSTMVFNTFVWMQIFNEFNNRRLDNKFNIFEGVHRNNFFIVINCIMVGAQIAIVFVGGKAFSITPIDGIQWAICIILAAFCLPWAIVVRLFPDAAFEEIAKTVGRPVVVMYHAVGRGMGRLAQKLSIRNKSKDRSNVDVTPEIVVVTPDCGRKTDFIDPEKGC